ncbi:MAG: hypothetical protein AUI33_13005, partial [Ignavibacteria bacterium 13_1_40CM_2_61_4]
MALFEPDPQRESEDILGSDAATRSLSVTVVENDFVARVYENLAWIYDVVFGPALHPGRVDAIRRMGIRPADRVLEVGVGTGINSSLYPRDCSVTGIDLSSSMLEKARDRIARKGVRNVRLLQMDAANLKFADDTFDIVYASYVISVVPDPVAVASEMRRVCRPGGRIVILNHFRSRNTLMAWLERLRSARVSGAGRAESGFDSEGERPADLVARDLHQRLIPFSVGGEKSRAPPARRVVASCPHSEVAMKIVTGIAIMLSALTGTVSAQWLKYPTAGVPKASSGRPDLTAPTPRTSDGKPDLSGIWDIEHNR